MRTPPFGPPARRLAALAVFCDFDGTLSPIVADPAAARPAVGAVDALVALAARCRVVAVVTGRPATFVDGQFPAAVRIAASYGLECRVDGLWAQAPEADRWRPVVGAASAEAASVFSPAEVVEAKGLSLTLHFRRSPNLQAEVEAWAAAAGARFGLDVRSAKASVELHPPVEIDKGTLVQRWSDGADTVVYFGDDRGDLAAFEALARLRLAGLSSTAIAVGGHEMPAELAAHADLVLPGPDAVVAYLVELAAAN